MIDLLDIKHLEESEKGKKTSVYITYDQAVGSSDFSLLAMW